MGSALASLLEGQGIYTAYDHTTPESGLGQSVAPVVLGLGRKELAELVHLTWPDAVRPGQPPRICP